MPMLLYKRKKKQWPNHLFPLISPIFSELKCSFRSSVELEKLNSDKGTLVCQCCSLEVLAAEAVFYFFIYFSQCRGRSRSACRSHRVVCDSSPSNPLDKLDHEWLIQTEHVWRSHSALFKESHLSRRKEGGFWHEVAERGEKKQEIPNRSTRDRLYFILWRPFFPSALQFQRTKNSY